MVATQAGIDLESFEYRSESDTYRTQYDQGTTPPSLAVIASLSKALDTPPVELEPLHEAVDGDALDELLRIRETADGDISVTFTFAGHSITVRLGLSAVGVAVGRSSRYRPLSTARRISSARRSARSASADSA
jgi:transcriptional regulator with XRE-family HTH domain